MKRQAIAAIVLIVGSPLAYADLEDQLQARWSGAWLIVNGELYSNCNGTTTDNYINGDLISGRGLRQFPAGELARITKVNVRRRRVDLTLALEEPVLMEHRDGPFTLYTEASCRVELIVDFADQRTKDLGIEEIEAQFGLWIDRYARRADAEQSDRWNQRERRDYPEDYELTLAEYRSWKVEQHNSLVSARIDESIGESRRLLAAVRTDADFGAGLSEGIVAMRAKFGSDCAQLVASTPDTYRQAAEAPSELWADGYQTGQHLAYHIELGRALEGCYLTPDDLPVETIFSSR